jgi:hypothetical protein
MEELLKAILEEIKGLRADLAAGRDDAVREYGESQKKAQETLNGLLRLFPGMAQGGKADGQ